MMKARMSDEFIRNFVWEKYDHIRIYFLHVHDQVE